jgi:DNA-binding transcriptional regulator YdaS (Cro superfamily)
MNKQQALMKIITKVGSQSELARRLGVTRDYVNHMVKGRSQISSKLVKKLVLLSEGEITEKDLRPDIFYDEFEEKKELRVAFG